MSMAAWENSAADKEHDGVRKFATGGMIDPAGPPAPMPAPRPNQMPNTMMQRNPMAQAPAMMPPRGQQNAMGRSIPRTEALRQWAEGERAKTRDAAAGQLMQKGQLEAYGGADNYSKALLDAAGTTNANGVRVGSAGFQKEAAQKGYDALQGMDEYKKWGLDNYDWSKQGVTMPTNTAATPAPAATTAPAATSPAANIVGQRSPQQAAQAAQPTQEDAMLGGIGALGGMGKKGPLPNNKVAPAQPTGQGQDKYLQNYIGGVGGKGSLPSNKMAAPQNQQMKPNRMMRSGGPVKKMASGGAVTRGNGCASRGLTKGRMR